MNQSQNNLVNVFEPNGIKWILNEAFSISIARFKLFVTLVAIIQIPAIILSLYFSGLTEQENRYDLILQIISYLTAFFAMTVSSSLIISAIGQHYAYNKVTWLILNLLSPLLSSDTKIPNPPPKTGILWSYEADEVI